MRKCRKITFDTWFGMEKGQRRATRRESGKTRDGRGRKIGSGCRRYVIIRHRSLSWPKAQIYIVGSDLMTSKANRWSVWFRRCSPTANGRRRRIKLCDWLAPLLMGSTENRFQNGLVSFSQSFMGLMHSWEAVHLYTPSLYYRVYISVTETLDVRCKVTENRLALHPIRLQRSKLEVTIQSVEPLPCNYRTITGETSQLGLRCGV